MPPPEPPTPDRAEDERLLDAARAGDDGAFARLIERNDLTARTLATAMLDGVGVDALVAESYVRAYRAVARQAGDPVPWLLRTTYLTTLAEARRRDRRRVGGPGRLPEPRPTEDEAPLVAMPHDERAVLVLVQQIGLAVDDVALVLEVPKPTIQALLDRARARRRGDRTIPLVAVAEHAADFWPALGRRLLAEREAPALPVPDLPEAAGAATALPGHQAPPVAMQRRAPRAARVARREPDSVDGLAFGARRRRVRTPARTRILQIAVVLVVIGALGAAIVAVVHLGARANSPVRKDSVADLSHRVERALDVGTMSMAYTRTTTTVAGRPLRRTFTLRRDDQGSYVVADTTGAAGASYDAATATLRRYQATGTGRTMRAVEERGVAAGPPDAPTADDLLPDADLDLALRTLDTATDVAAVRSRQDGQAVWVLTAPLPSGTSDQADEVRLVVDQARLVPVQLQFRSGRTVVRSTSYLVALDTPSNGPYLADPPGARFVKENKGFLPVRVDAVAAAVGYEPLRPTFLPAGFTLAATTVRNAGKVVVFRYARGFQQVVVTTRTSPVPEGARWSDPFGRSRPDSVDIAKGPYRGTTAQRVSGLGVVPRLWGTDGRLAFTVSGDLTDAQLVQVVESLR